MVCLDTVTRRFGHTVALKEVSLQIARGALYGILGPDGSGKTTLLRLVVGLLNPSHSPTGGLRESIQDRLHPLSGHIVVNGYDTVRQPEMVKRLLGYMPQNFGLYDDLSVDENLNFAADVYELPGAIRPARIKELLAFAGLERFRSRQARLLSGGMKKKLALACAILHRPALLLLDEPTTGVDPVARRSFWDLLSKLHAEGITIIVSTPYMDEAERCNGVALLFEGQVLAVGSPAEIKARVPGHVLAVQGTNARAAAEILHDMPGLLETQTYGAGLNLIVDGETATMKSEVAERLAAHQIPFDGIEPMPMRMEEAFIYLTNAAPQQGATR